MPKLWVLTGFIGQGVNSLLLSRALIQSQSDCYLIIAMPLFAPLGTSCLAVWYCSLYVSHLSHTVKIFSLLPSIIAHYVLWSLASLEEASRSVPTWFFYIFKINECCVFSNSVLPTNSGSKQKRVNKSLSCMRDPLGSLKASCCEFNCTFNVTD